MIKEIVGAKIGDLITNNRERIVDALKADMDVQFLDKTHMQLMAALDLGTNWERMADGPILFLLEEVDGEIINVYPPEEYRN